MYDWLTDNLYQGYSHWGFIQVSAAVFNEAEDERINAFIAEHERLHKLAAEKYAKGRPWNVALDLLINDLLSN